MRVEHPNRPPLSSADLEQLSKLEDLLQRSVRDGVITRAELEAIDRQIAADGKVTLEELELVRRFIRDRVEQDELVIDFFDQM